MITTDPVGNSATVQISTACSRLLATMSRAGKQDKLSILDQIDTLLLRTLNGHSSQGDTQT